MLARALPWLCILLIACDPKPPAAKPTPEVEPGPARDAKAEPVAEAPAEAPRAPEPADAEPTPSRSVKDRAEQVRTRVLRFPPSKGLPGSMLEGASISNLVEIDSCDTDDCLRNTKMTGEQLSTWLAGFEEIPGWDVAALSKCKDDCCTFANLARDAARDGGNVPHELLELRAVCFADDGTIRRIKWIQY